MLGDTLTNTISSQIGDVITRLDAWLETIRGPGGYGGPVAHWWQQSLMYTGTGLDWRYEGIITGYLQLWKNTGNETWLMKARRAGNDLISGQLDSGNYAASAFEANPATAGTPHEAACDVGLLSLALTLQECGSVDWEQYSSCAERNLRAFYIEKLWDTETQSFRDGPRTATFVPNKAATACEALFLLTMLTGTDIWVEYYAIPTLERILEYQVQHTGWLDGAIAQNSLGTRKIEKYFPLYIGRCIPALLRGYHWTNDGRYAEAALRAMQFIARTVYEDGSFPAVVYPNQQVNRYPSWIAAVGDILRAAEALRPFGFDADLSATKQWLLAGQDATGGIQTACGFAAQTGGRLPKSRDVRDVLHVTGWCDKAFRYLASYVESDLPTVESAAIEAECIFRGYMMKLCETTKLLEISTRHGVCYRWHKGEPWPEIASSEFWLQ